MESWLELQECRMQPSFVTLGNLRRYSTTEEVADSCGTCAHDASQSSCLTLKDKRSGLVALALKRSLVETRSGILWTHSAAHLAMCMTEGSDEAQKRFELLERKNWRWRLVYDPYFSSAHKRVQKRHDVLGYPPSALDETDDVKRTGGCQSFLL